VLFEDSAAMLGLVVAFVGIWLTQATGILIIDGIASVLIGFILVGTAIWLAYETKGLLIGESASQAVMRGIRDLLQAQMNVEHINEVLTMHMGPDFILATISVDFVDSADAQRIESDIVEINRAIQHKFPQIKRVFIEVGPRGNKYPQTS
jgi:divalent metal cation (Fe/Co/Zn/Cd) transporter